MYLLTNAICRYNILFATMWELPDEHPGLDSPLSSLPEDPLVLPVSLEGNDMGVAKWARMDVPTIMTRLGFLGGRPTLFAAWRSRSGLHRELNEIPDADREFIMLLWHQAVAVAALTEAFWTAEPVDGGVPGVLLADTVGLGKTIELIGLIAMLVQTRMAELLRSGGLRAAILGEYDCIATRGCSAHASVFSLMLDYTRADTRPYFCGLESDNGAVPDLPIAIIVPVSLAAQWLAELKTFLAPKSIEVYNFPTAAAEWAEFWAPDSAWSRSLHPKYLRIIIFQHSVRTTVPLGSRASY